MTTSALDRTLGARQTPVGQFMSKRLIDGSVRQREDGIIFPRRDWDVIQTLSTEQNPAGVELRAEPGTWMKPPKGADPAWIGLVACPSCSTISVLHSRIHSVEWVRETLSPKFVCTGAQRRITNCRFESVLVLEHWNKKTLYACVLQQHKPVRYANGAREIKQKIEIWYLHANDERDARIQLGPLNLFPNSYNPNWTKIVSIAPAIGAIAKDDNGDELAIDSMAK
jgi:hypothetical protein